MGSEFRVMNLKITTGVNQMSHGYRGKKVMDVCGRAVLYKRVKWQHTICTGEDRVYTTWHNGLFFFKFVWVAVEEQGRERILHGSALSAEALHRAGHQKHHNQSQIRDSDTTSHPGAPTSCTFFEVYSLGYI